MRDRGQTGDVWSMGSKRGSGGLMRPALAGASNEHAIVFIHGLGGAPLSTWRAMLNLIGGDAAFDSITLDCYAYPTKLVEIPFLARPPGLKEIVEGLRTYLHDRFRGYKRLDLVAHSLGGVVTKAFLVEELSARTPLPIRKVALIAVPSAGSSLASVGRIVSFRHRQLKALCKNSSQVRTTDQAWRNGKFADKVDVEYILGGQDRCVSRESACIEADTIPSMLINANHRNIVAPQDRNDSRYTILTKFLLGTEDRRSAPVRPADPLFEQYKPDHEHYYVERRFDHGLASAISAGHIWVCGKSGVGKSAALRRAVYRNRWGLKHINLSAYGDTSPLGMICALADELALLATNLPAALTERSFEAACQSIRTSLVCLCRESVQAIVVEEIPLGENAVPEFLDYLSRLLQLLSGTEHVDDRLILAFSSIVDLSTFGSAISEKTRECIQILADPVWSFDDLRKLACMLAEWLSLSFSLAELEQICVAAKGRPRFIKQLFRIYRNGCAQGETLATLIERVRSEVL